MREIKFRAWNGSVMRYTTAEDMPEFCVMDGKAYTLFDGESCFPKARDWPVMQYTGLKGKNGKEIYEGDIVRWRGDIDLSAMWEKYGDTENWPNNTDDWIFEMNTDTATMERFPVCWLKNEEFGYEGEDLVNPETQAVEVIGNIHENPELLESP